MTLHRPSSPLPPAMRWLGPPLALGFGWCVSSRDYLYRWGLLKVHRAALPVISIGNLTAGGTGKTPTVKFLAREFLRRGLIRKPAILLRGYGAKHGSTPSDEALELQAALPECAVIVNPDRVVGAQIAKASGCDLVLLDDGFQHRRLARDLDLVLLDATQPFGGGHLLPWGFLRESPQALQRADALLLTRCDQVDLNRVRREIGETLRALKLELPLIESRHRPVGLRKLFASDRTIPLADLENPVAAACGLGNPQAFFRTLENHGAALANINHFADHHIFTQKEFDALICDALASGAKSLIVTGKDAVKLERLRPPTLDVFALEIELELLSGAECLWALLGNLCRKNRSMNMNIQDSKI